MKRLRWSAWETAGDTDAERWFRLTVFLVGLLLAVVVGGSWLGPLAIVWVVVLEGGSWVVRRRVRLRREHDGPA